MNINSKLTNNKQLSNIPDSSNIIKIATPIQNFKIFSSNMKTRSKPLSMNDSMLRQILKEPIKKPTLVKAKLSSKLSQSINKPSKSNFKDKDSSDNSTLAGQMNAEQISFNTSGVKSVKNQSFNIITEKNPKPKLNCAAKTKSKVTFNNKRCLITLNPDIPLPSNKHLQKNPSNGSTIEAFSNQSYTSTDREFFLSTSSNLKTFNTFNMYDSFKLTEELLDFKLGNSKLKNEISILNEKIKTMKQVIVMKTDENDMIKSSYAEIIEENKKESEKARKYITELSSMKETINKQSFHLSSIVSVMTELLEIFVSSRSPYAFGNSNIMTRQSITINNENISATDIDVYYSYKDEDDKRTTLIEQIQGLLVAKLNVIKRSVPNLDIEKEIDRIKSWNFIKNPNESEINISNLRLSKNIIEESCSESFRKNCSNDFFDLSISNQIMSQSPKFNSRANSVCSVSDVGFTKDLIEKNSTINNVEKIGNTFLLNDSFLKDLKQNESFSEDKNGSVLNVSIIDNHLNMNEKERDNVEINITDCSIIDLNGESKSKEAKMLFNDDPTEFNIEFNVIPNMVTGDEQINPGFFNSFQNGNENEGDDLEVLEEEPPTPVILNPIVNNNTTLSFSK